MATFRSKNKPLRTFKAAKRTVPTGNHRVTIDRLATDGRGVARPAGKTVFVVGALPGEVVDVRYSAVHKNYDEAVCVMVKDASANRVTAQCAHYQNCGGCNLQHLSYDEQLLVKQDGLQQQLNHLLIDDKHGPLILSEAVVGQAYQYRHRARLTVTANKKNFKIGFKQSASHQTVDIERCEVLYPELSQLIAAIKHCISRLKGRSSIEQLLLVEDGDSHIYAQLISKKMLPQNDLDVLQDLAKSQLTIECALQESGKPYWQSQIKQPFYKLEKYNITIPFTINDFTQINPVINQQMIDRACDWLSLSDSDVVADFFCGVGNFSLPIARYAKQVFGYEVVDQMVDKATSNAVLNKLDNIEFSAVDLFKQSLPNQLLFNKALLDPPRAGAEFLCRELSQLNLDCLIYVSCNPISFFRDAKILLEGGYTIDKMSMIDMFPQTAHVELIASFSKIR